MMNWNEVIRKENKSSQIYDKFDINPHNLYIVAEKPNKVVKDKKEEDEKKKKDPKIEEVEEKLRAKITESKLTPQMKYKHPVTASQEIGWIGNEVAIDNEKLNRHFQSYNLSSCQETLFGSNYYAMKGYGPYSNKNNTDMGKGEKGKSPPKKK